MHRTRSLILITVLGVVGCSSMPLGPAKTRGAGPNVSYQLCANGLPHDGMWKGDPDFADVNGDGHMDLAAIPRLGNGAHVWLGDSKGNWTNSSNGLYPGEKTCGGGVCFSDVNNDGYIDLAVADHCAGAYIYLGNGHGEWTIATIRLNPPDYVDDTSGIQQYIGAEDLDVGDINGDGHADLVVVSSDLGGINLYHGDGTGRNWKRYVTGLSSADWATRVQVTDVNNDGSLDVVSAYAAGPRVWLNDGKGELELASNGLPSPVIKGIYNGLGVSDLNNDGLPDIAIANWVDGPEAYLQQSNGSWVKTPDVFPSMLGGAYGLAIGDINLDGNVDIVVSGRLTTDPGYVRGVYVLRGNGDGSWTYDDESGLPPTGLSSVSGVGVCDVTGDGVPDIAACSGLIVETVPGQTGPFIPHRMLVWCGTLSGTGGGSEVRGSAFLLPSRDRVAWHGSVNVESDPLEE